MVISMPLSLALGRPLVEGQIATVCATTTGLISWAWRSRKSLFAQPWRFNTTVLIA